MSEYDNNLQVIVGKVVSDNPKAPTLNVQVEIRGKKYSAGVWPWRRGDKSLVKDKHGNMQYIGTLKEWDPENPGAQRRGGRGAPTKADKVFEEAHAAAQADEFEDDIPF